MFCPFDLETIEVRYRDKSDGKALPHIISRHTHPKAKPETTEPQPSGVTGIDYLSLTAAAHHKQIRRDERIGYHGLYARSMTARPRGSSASTTLQASTRRVRC